MHKFAAVVDHSALVVAHMVAAAPCARTGLPPTALARMLSFVSRLMAPLLSEKNSLKIPAGVLAAVFVVRYVARFFKLERI
jgi:hypothetical protein